MPTLDQLQDPDFTFQAGAPFAERFGVTADPLTQPLAYEEAMYALNPRTAKGMLRLELEEATTEWTPEDEALIHQTSEDLGIKEPEYPFELGREYDLMIIAGGARNALIDRGLYGAKALESGLIEVKKTVVIGEPRRIDEKRERPAIGDWVPPHVTTAFGMATAAVDRMRAEYPDVYGESDAALSALHLQSRKPDQRAAVNEAILREGVRAGGRIAVVTTALYVPFKIHKSRAIGTPLGVEVDVVGVPSRQSVIDARTPDTYFSEITQTQMSAAQHSTAVRRLRR
ncbi:MAG TPA: hypothetical protein VLH86_01150 [Patescibacteria group bacterium]|nr:hypothetical protein [Patescibacteria group bacterium]